MTFGKIDMYVDLTYGILLLVGIAAMIFLQHYLSAVTFGLGILIGYAVHIGWRMARFDPEAKTTFEENVEQTVEETVENAVEDAVNDN